MQSNKRADEAADGQKQAIRDRAADLGFVACAFTSASPIERGKTLHAWISEGRHGYMDYLARDETARTTPAQYLPGARSVIVVAAPYALTPPPAPAWRQRLVGRIASYAGAVDYHDDLGERLARLGDYITARYRASVRAHVDAGPLLERELALRAGLGWFGRHSNILLPWQRTPVLLGCLLTDHFFPSDPPFLSSHCGDCRDCLPACPTEAIEADHWLDARRCISYLTIEAHGPIPAELRPMMENWVFGCDACLQVCPWTPPGPRAPDCWFEPSLERLLLMSEDEFRGRYRHSPIWRAKRRGMARNAAVALGNSGNRHAADALSAAVCEDREALVRAHAAWALGRLEGGSGASALRRALKRESVPPVREEIESALRAFR